GGQLQPGLPHPSQGHHHPDVRNLTGTRRAGNHRRRAPVPSRVRHFDLVIVGTGSGNSILDARFAGWDVAIVEEGVFGGTCLNVGCIPTKMFVYPADLAEHAADSARLGVDSELRGV